MTSFYCRIRNWIFRFQPRLSEIISTYLLTQTFLHSLTRTRCRHFYPPAGSTQDQTCSIKVSEKAYRLMKSHWHQGTGASQMIQISTWWIWSQPIPAVYPMKDLCLVASHGVARRALILRVFKVHLPRSKSRPILQIMCFLHQVPTKSVFLALKTTQNLDRRLKSRTHRLISSIVGPALMVGVNTLCAIPASKMIELWCDTAPFFMPCSIAHAVSSHLNSLGQECRLNTLE